MNPQLRPPVSFFKTMSCVIPLDVYYYISHSIMCQGVFFIFLRLRFRQRRLKHSARSSSGKSKKPPGSEDRRRQPKVQDQILNLLCISFKTMRPLNITAPIKSMTLKIRQAIQGIGVSFPRKYKMM